MLANTNLTSGSNTNIPDGTYSFSLSYSGLNRVVTASVGSFSATYTYAFTGPNDLNRFGFLQPVASGSNTLTFDVSISNINYTGETQVGVPQTLNPPTNLTATAPPPRCSSTFPGWTTRGAKPVSRSNAARSADRGRRSPILSQPIRSPTPMPTCFRRPPTPIGSARSTRPTPATGATLPPARRTPTRAFPRPTTPARTNLSCRRTGHRDDLQLRQLVRHLADARWQHHGGLHRGDWPADPPRRRSQRTAISAASTSMWCTSGHSTAAHTGRRLGHRRQLRYP